MTIRSEARLQQSLDEVTRLLDKHRVQLTLVTDAIGFFLFLGLARVILF